MRPWTLALIGAVLFLAGCQAGPSEVVSLDPSGYDALAATDGVTVIDVHVPEQEHLPGTDAVIPYDDLEALMAASPDKDAPVLLYCRSGSMSRSAAERLVAEGYTQVYDLIGGRNAYVEIV